MKTSNKKPTSSNNAKRGETEHLNQGQEFVFVPNQDQKQNKMDWSSKIGYFFLTFFGKQYVLNFFLHHN